MTIQAALAQHLMAELAAIVGQRVYPVQARQLAANESLEPTVVYLLAAREEKAVHLGGNSLTVTVWDFHCIAESYDGAHELAEALIGCLRFFRGLMSRSVRVEHAILRNSSDDGLSEVGYFSVFVQFEIASSIS